MLSKRAGRLKESATLQVSGEAMRLRDEGVDIINLGMGEPDFDSPEHVKQAAIQAVRDNRSHYTINRGILPLRQAISQRMKADYNADYAPDQIIVTNGAKQSIFNILMALIDKGDEVIMPAPVWPTHPEAVGLADGSPVVVQTREEDGFKLTPSQLREAITKNTRALMLSNPCNPTGMVYNRDELTTLMKELQGTNIFFLSDEVYAPLRYGLPDYVSGAAFRDMLNDRVIIFQAVSKAYAMTGWRIGFTMGPKDIIKAADKIQGHSTSNAAAVSQYAALAALTGPQDVVEKMRAVYEERRAYMQSRLQQMPGLSFVVPQGAFYFFPNISGCYGTTPSGKTIANSTDLALYLLQEAHVAMVPGSGFEAEGYLRISYAASMENLQQAMDRMEKALSRIRRE